MTTSDVLALLESAYLPGGGELRDYTDRLILADALTEAGEDLAADDLRRCDHACLYHSHQRQYRGRQTEPRPGGGTIASTYWPDYNKRLACWLGNTQKTK